MGYTLDMFSMAIGRRKKDKFPIIVIAGPNNEIVHALDIGEDTYELLQRDIQKAKEGNESS